MKTHSTRGRGIHLVFALALGLGIFVTPRGHAQEFSVIHSFTGGKDGANPLAGFVTDAAQQNAYGTASAGGKYGAGVVFQLNQHGETVLYSFTGGVDGANPQASLILDAAGNVYGTTFAGGKYGAGVVFKVSKKVESVLYNFAGGADGANPESHLVMDSAGNLYGTTSAGGAYGLGTVFEVTPDNRETVLYSFGKGTDGATPVAGLTLDASGNLYGTTSAGGLYTYGTVFQLTQSGSSWTENILYNFQMGSDGGVPYAGLTFDGSGNLYGAATDGGDGGSNGGGTIFKLSPGKGSWTFTLLYSLPGWGISGSFRDLLMDAAGNIYATTHCDGANSAGTVFKLTPAAGAWKYTSLYVFTGGKDGLYSFSNLVADKSGNLYGTTNQGGANGSGVIFRVKP